MSTTSAESNVGIAFSLVIGASLATAVGASVVFIPSIVKLADSRILAGSLGFSVGVMAYVSFIEIFPKSQQRFEAIGYNANKSFNLATLSFFGGVAVMLLLNVIVHKITGHKHCHNDSKKKEVTQDQIDIEAMSEQPSRSHHDTSKKERSIDAGTISNTADFDCEDDWGLMCLPGTFDELEFLKHIAYNVGKQTNTTEEVKNQNTADNEVSEQCPVEQCCNHQDTIQEVEHSSVSGKNTDGKLLHMGLLTAIAIGLHNFPEGLATYVAVLDNPSVGAVLAIAIAIHNIPEGLCVALPVYYATGSRRKAFLWGTLSGMTELIAAVFGWAVLRNNYSDKLFGVLFGLVSGMMVIISLRELLPTAHKHDPHDKIVTISVIVGMIVMGLSLVLFRL